MKSRFENKTNDELVAVLESVDAYTPDAQIAAAEILQERNILPSSLESLALMFWDELLTKSLRDYLKSGVAPKSKFLSDEQIKTLFAKKYDEYVERKELMAVDSTLYWFAI